MCQCANGEKKSDICGETMHTEYIIRQQQQNTSNTQMYKI
jgi:hypothetical protein